MRDCTVALFGAFISFFCVPSWAVATDVSHTLGDSAGPVLDLHESVVTASKSRTSQNLIVDKVQVVDSAAIRRTGTFNVIELLGTVPGMDIDPNRTRNNLKLNGLGGNYVKILVDGIPVSGDVGGGYPLENLMLGDLESIEVLSGASSTLYGSDAMAGVVNFITKKHRQPTKLGVDAQVRHLHNDTLFDWGGKNRADISMFHANANFDVDLFGGVDNDDGTFSTSRIEGEKYTRYVYPQDYRYKYGGRVAVHPYDSWSVVPSASQSGSATRYTSGTNLLRIATESQTYNISGDWEPSPWLDVTGYGSFRSLQHDHKTVTQVGFTSTKLSETDFQDREAELRVRAHAPVLHSQSAEWMLGGNFLEESVASDNLRSDEIRHQAAIFSVATWASRTSPQVVITPSGRATLTDREPQGESWSFDDLSPKLGVKINQLQWKPLSVSVVYGEAFKNPTLKHMYYSFNMGNSSWIEGNEDLQPEHSRTLSASIDWNQKKWLASLSGYTTRLQDMIVLADVMDSNGNQAQRGLNGETGTELTNYRGALLPEKRYTNADRGETWGIRSELQHRPWQWLQMGFSYAHTVSRARASNGRMQDVTEVCPNVAQVTLTFVPAQASLWPEASVLAQWNDQTIDSWSADTALYSDSFTRINVQLAKSFAKGMTFDLGVENLLDHTREGHLGLNYGRTYYMGLRWNAPKLL